jgi:hypothetical protein
MPTRGQRRSFYEALGRAISAWQEVESGIYEVFRELTASERPGAVAAAFFAMNAFGQKLDMTNAAAHFVLFKTDLFDTWVNLNDTAQKLYGKRNALAHQVVWVKYGEEQKEQRIFIAPQALDLSRTLPRQRRGGKPPKPPDPPITLREIQQYKKKFTDLAGKFLELARQIPPPSVPPQ